MGTSIIILTYNNLEKTKLCLESIRKYTKEEVYEIIVVDNHSTDGTKEWLKVQNDIKVIYNDTNLGFPIGCNQGIEIANHNYDILLLNNDTIVTSNWLTNLRKCLYHSNSIGAVGPISNCNDNLQGCNFIYNDYQDMQSKASLNNISDNNRWEEKAFLIGFCLLIKREVINKIKVLDTSYSPGYIEDNDLSLQIISLGYKLFLCHDSFVYHDRGTAFRSDTAKFNALILKNRQIFENKWHFSCFEFDKSKNASIFLGSGNNILDYNSGIGVSSLRIKYYFKNANITSLESDDNKRLFSNKFFKTVKSLEELDNSLFDTIYIGNSLESVDNPFVFLKSLKRYLTNNGKIVGECKNIGSIKNISLLLSDNWYYENFKKQNHFTSSDITNLAADSGYKVTTIYPFTCNLNDKEKELEKLFSSNSLNTYYYSFILEKL